MLGSVWMGQALRFSEQNGFCDCAEILSIQNSETYVVETNEADSMDSGSKGGVDQISGLPDDILCHILSFLPTKYAVATSILSTRWKYVWSSVPILDFNASLHRDFFPFLNFYGSKQSEISFRRFVNRVLLLNDAHIKKFRLIYERHYIAAPIHTWLHLAISRDILELELDFNMSVPKESIKFLRNLFMSNTLVVLKLSRMPLIVPSVVCFPMLKVLEIRRVIYLDDICTRNLLLGCQVLEELVIEEIIRERPRVIDISIPTLKKFSFSYKFVTDISTDCPYRFVFNAPNLQYFHVKGRISDDFDVKSLASLVDVHLDLRETAVLAENYNQCHQRICDFFKELANANSLILSSDIVELFCTVADPNLPRFYNMKNLGLGINYNPDFCWKRLVKEFIKCSPDLDALTLYNKQGILRDIEELRRNPPKAVPDHLLSYLKEVFIQELYSNFLPEDVECMVQDMKVLKQLKINCQCPIILVIQIGYTAQVK